MPVDEDENPYRIPKNRLHRFLKRLNVRYPNLGVISFVSAEEYKEYYDAVYKRNILRARYGEGCIQEADGKTRSQYERMFGCMRRIDFKLLKVLVVTIFEEGTI
ncbi:3-dehydroquinate synthase [Trichinella spiralis]|uniref:3-dehydroquinate synthase n=1 Tax=Trichinella spiralis TaxID=6334 RepID=A0ABR3K620_TRISP